MNKSRKRPSEQSHRAAYARRLTSKATALRMHATSRARARCVSTRNVSYRQNYVFLSGSHVRGVGKMFASRAFHLDRRRRLRGAILGHLLDLLSSHHTR